MALSPEASAAPAAADDALFDRDGWWDPACRPFASLRAVSEFRFALLHSWLPRGFAGLCVVDAGCGGGLLAVPAARAGARVVGVDRAARALGEARAQGAGTFLAVQGELGALPLAAGVADLVLLADVLEHVEAPARAVAEAARVLRPGGHLFVNTIDRTLRSRVLAITLGEGLGFVPRGTHRWSKFVRPHELDRMAGAAGLRRVARTGEAPRIWATLRRRAVVLRRSASLAVGYAAMFERGPT